MEDEGSIKNWKEKLDFPQLGVPTWLHPEWSQSNDQPVLASITEWIKENSFPYRAGFQIHKLFQADERDNRSKPAAALCAEPGKID